MQDRARVDDRLSPAELADYLVEVGGTLLAYGCPTYRLERVLRSVARLEGYVVDVFGVPTGLFISLTGPGVAAPLLRMKRVKTWATNLERLAIVDGIFNDVADDRCSIGDAIRRLHDLETRRPPYPPLLAWIAVAAATGAAAVFFRGGAPEIVAATIGGMTVALVGVLSRNLPSGRFFGDFVGGAVAALVAWGATWLRPAVSREVIVLSSIILLVPGMTLTTGLAELAQRDLVAGAARLMEAFVVLLSITIGIALVIGVEQLTGSSVGVGVPRVGFGLAGQLVGMIAACGAFAVLFAVPRPFAWTALCSGGIGWTLTALGARYFPGYIAAFVAALAVCLFANGCARVTQRPAQIFQLPGIVLLVPGSIGFLSLEAFLRGEFLGGAGKGFEMILIGGALVTGVLVANVVLPARKLL